VKTLALLIGLGATVIPGIAAAQESACVACHQSFEAEDGPSFAEARSVHGQNGISCHDCHGGDPALDDMDEVRRAKNWRGVPGHLEIPEFCARCHSDPAYMHEHNPGLPTDQLAKYRTSVHGQRLFAQKDGKVADCVACHGAHDIGDAAMPHSRTHPQNIPATCGKCHADAAYMAEYGIATDQVADYTASVHSQALLDKGDLGAPACNDCHGNHGAAPPGVASLSAVCGTCHAFQMELFNQSPHAPAFAAAGFPMCETCHGNHRIEHPTDEWVGTDEPAVCIQCHSGDDGTRAFAVAAAISHNLDSLRTGYDSAQAVVARARGLGMATTESAFGLQDIRQALIQLRTTVHALSAEQAEAKAAEGFTLISATIGAGERLVDEYYFRRKGLGLATLCITVLAVALWLKIRRLR